MGDSMTRRLSSVPRLGATGTTSTTDVPIAIPAPPTVYQVKIWVDVASRARVDESSIAIVPSATNMGYLEAGREEAWDIRPGTHTHIHLTAVTGAGNYRITYYS